MFKQAYYKCAISILSQSKREIAYADNRNKSFKSLTKQQQNHKHHNRVKH